MEKLKKKNSIKNIKKIIAVISGKGGVGKSTVSVLTAKMLKSEGYKVGILDADVTGPSIPRLTGISDGKVSGSKDGMIPVETKEGIKVMSLNLLMQNEEEPVIWRGPMISNMVSQFYEDTVWGDIDYLIIDMPPGTSDVPLTVMQNIPVDGAVIVSVPQDMVSMIVSKSIKMVKKLNINILGLIENMSYIICPKCSENISLFEGKNTNEFLKQNDLKLLCELPLIKCMNFDDKKVQALFKTVIDSITNKMKIEK